MRAAMVAVTLLACAASGFAQAASGRDPQRDRETLIKLEHEWADSVNSEAFWERLYAPDFVHIIADGRIISRHDELEYRRSIHLDTRATLHFEEMQVRIYDDVGVVTGRTIASGAANQVLRKTSFTDVFLWRDGHWRAVNAQETTVDPKYMK